MESGFPPARDEPTRQRMRGYRRTDTKPELQLRSALHRAGYRFRVNYPLRPDTNRPIRPDIVFTKARLAIFVDGCFWHGCPVHGSIPLNNRSAWESKLKANQQRDLKAVQRLTDAGWCAIRLWEHVPVADALATVVTALDGARRDSP